MWGCPKVIAAVEDGGEALLRTLHAIACATSEGGSPHHQLPIVGSAAASNSVPTGAAAVAALFAAARESGKGSSVEELEALLRCCDHLAPYPSPTPESNSGGVGGEVTAHRESNERWTLALGPAHVLRQRLQAALLRATVDAQQWARACEVAQALLPTYRLCYTVGTSANAGESDACLVTSQSPAVAI